MNTIRTRHRRQFETDLTPHVRTEMCGFFLTPDESHRLKAEAQALNTSVSCLVRESLRKTRIL